MTENFYIKKITHYFNMYDYNGNGVIEASDLLIPAERLTKIRGWGPNSGKTAVYIAGIKQMTIQLIRIADENNDGVISLEEYIKYWVGMAAAFHAGNEQVVTMLQAIALDTGNMLDGNNDGKVTWEEYDQFMRSFRDDMYFDTKAAFAILDLDSNGVISIPEEIIQISQDFLVSDDPTAPGNWIFGPISGTDVTLPAE